MQVGVIHQDIIDRYDTMLAKFAHKAECIPVPGTHLVHLRWMLSELRTMTDEGKANRWLGFIQGIMIFRGFTTVQVERDFTRPYFQKGQGTD